MEGRLAGLSRGTAGELVGEGRSAGSPRVALGDMERKGRDGQLALPEQLWASWQGDGD